MNTCSDLPPIAEILYMIWKQQKPLLVDSDLMWKFGNAIKENESIF